MTSPAVESIASNCFSLDYLQEPTNVLAEFIYSKYEANETDNETATDPASRSVRISFSYTVEASLSDISLVPEKIHTSADLITERMSQISIKDTGILKRTYQSFERSCKIRSIDGNSTDKAQKLSKRLGVNTKVDLEILQKVAVNYSAQSLRFFNLNKEIPSDKFSNVSGLPVSALISDKIVYDALKTSETSFPERCQVSLGLLANDEILERQTSERAKGSKIGLYSSDTIFDAIQILDEPNALDAKLVAFQIERTESLSNGQVTTSVFNVEDKSVRFYVDETIKYGSKYTYSVKAVYEVDTSWAWYSESESQIPRPVKVLIASVPSNLSTVFTSEKVPPPPPVDVNFRFDHQRSEMSVRWEFPVNRSQDITRFQVFRRQSSNDPFLLLKEFDFDKSEFKVERPDAPLQVNVSLNDYPVRSYVDRDFGRSSTYIYAVCSVDAHGYASNYSAQYEVSFDMRTRSLRVQCVSPSGAPRPYPNLFFDTRQPLISDSITRGKISSVNFVFDPEYLVVTDRAGNSLEVVKYFGTNQAKYYMNVIDTNRAEQISIPVEIRNLKTS
jgi:hypothetical protein